MIITSEAGMENKLILILAIVAFIVIIITG